jgi:hypothetical protein
MKQLAIALCSLLTLSAAAHADTNELRIAKQPGLSYLPAVIAEKLQLVEKHARAAGLSDFKTTWTRLTNGGASNDALLSGNVDMVISGGPNMLILWAKTSGRVKGVVATGALPMLLVTNNPNVKTIADFTDQDRIAVPTIRVGTQPAVLGIAVEKQFGLGAVELALPPVGVLLGVGVDRLALAPVVPLLDLHVAVQAEGADGDPAGHRPLVDAAAAGGQPEPRIPRDADRVDAAPHFLAGSALDSAATKASCGTSTRPTIFIRFLPSFCFSSSLRLRVMSPP